MQPVPRRYSSHTDACVFNSKCIITMFSPMPVVNPVVSAVAMPFFPRLEPAVLCRRHPAVCLGAAFRSLPVQTSLAESGVRGPESPHPRNKKTTPDAGLRTPRFTAGDCGLHLPQGTCLRPHVATAGKLRGKATTIDCAHFGAPSFILSRVPRAAYLRPGL
jgi:hypothetical protein